MLNVWMYQAWRVFSHSGRCWTTLSSATSSGGSIMIAGIRNTIDVWYVCVVESGERRGIWTTKS